MIIKDRHNEGKYNFKINSGTLILTNILYPSERSFQQVRCEDNTIGNVPYNVRDSSRKYSFFLNILYDLYSCLGSLLPVAKFDWHLLLRDKKSFFIICFFFLPKPPSNLAPGATTAPLPPALITSLLLTYLTRVSYNLSYLRP